MTSTKFSRRPRVQPTPKICRKPPQPYPPPPPPPPGWPPTWCTSEVDWQGPMPGPPPPPPQTLTVTIDWDGPLDPPPDWHIHEELQLPWDEEHQWYHGFTTGPTDIVEVWAQLQTTNRRFLVNLLGRRNGAPVLDVQSDEIYIPPCHDIDLTITEWLALPPTHSLTGKFAGTWTSDDKWLFAEQALIPWIPAESAYRGPSDGYPDRVWTTFTMNPATGDYSVKLEAWHADELLFTINATDRHLTPGVQIDQTITSWDDAPLCHTCQAHIFTWPPATLTATINAHGPWGAEKPINVHSSVTMPWDAAKSWYHGKTPGPRDHAEIWFVLTPANGWYQIDLTLSRGETVTYTLHTDPAQGAYNAPIRVTVIDWIGQPRDLFVVGQFRSEP